MVTKQKEIIVVKRDGSKELYDVTKIKSSIAFATQGKQVNPLQLEASLDQFVKSGMTTSNIQENVIRHAVQLATPSSPEWLNVAGRALAMQMWADYKLRGKSFHQIVQYNIKKGEYSSDLNDFYSKDDIENLGNSIDMNRDLAHSHSSLITVQKKYLGKYELNQHMHMVTAMRFGQLEEKANRIDFVKDLYDCLSLRKISLATPFMSNIRKGGNVASCFIIAIEDDLDSIFQNIHRIAKISKNGGGLGIFLGFLRAKGSTIGTYENAAGSITQWIKIINDTLVAVNQSFDGNTFVETQNGKKRIADITKADFVKTHNGEYKSVLSVKKNKNSTPIFEVSTEKGKTLVTENHPVFVVENLLGLDKEKLTAMIKDKTIKPQWVDVSKLTNRHLILKPI